MVILSDMSSPLSRARAVPELWLLFVLSALLHFWKLFTPNAVVFDELHYERFTGYYLQHAYLFDVHPPVGRLLFVAFAAALHLPATKLIIPEPFPVLRIVTAAFATFLVPLVYILLRQLGANRRVATFGATLLLLENALLVMGRLILVDITLIVFGLIALTTYLATHAREGRVRWAWLAASAFFAGLALSIKWTGASALGIVLATWFFDALKRRRRIVHLVGEGALLTLIPAAIYLGAFYLHFALLTHTGPGDVYMAADFRAQQIGSVQFVPGAHLSFWAKLAQAHHAMSYGNSALEFAINPGASPWYTWPIMKHPISLWGDPRVPGDKQMLILLGNPVVWWAGLIAFFAGTVSFVLQRERWRGHEFGYAFLMGGVLLNYVPFMAIKRLMYLYHYLFALTLLTALAAYVFGVMTRTIDDDAPPWRIPTRRMQLVYGGVLALVLIGFVYFLPFTYGWRVSAAGFDHRFWVLHPY